MDKPAKDAIHDLALSLRKTLEAEVERELGRYGIYADRAWIDADSLLRLTDKERDEDRPRIEAVVRREQDAGLSQAEAVRAFIRETAYTHMNRLLGLKCMEVRGLIDETITTRSIYSERSKRHRDYLDEHAWAHREPNHGLVAMLQQAYAEVSQHIGVVFDPDSDYSVVWPRHTVLKACIDQINDLDAEVARKRGEDPEVMVSVYTDDTVLGWVYQYFQDEEKARVFREASTNKISGHDIIPATTAYTDHYIVQFLVENSLGALWVEMYPDSDLCERWEYFVEDPNLQNEDGTRKPGRDPRPVAELALLDPASGSGHFLLYGFDLFAQLYEAEARMRGRPVNRAEIARSIVRYNLHGIDIDLRSVQLSALNLYMKACTYAGMRLDGLQRGERVSMNLVCADIVLHEGPELGELLVRFKGDPLTQELIWTLWQGLQNARELGSLLKVEEQVDGVIARKREAEKGTFWEHPDEAWELWRREFLNTLTNYVDRAAEAFDVNRRMFGQEAIKSVQLLDLLTRRYAVVATNPPYMSRNNLKKDVRDALRDLYSWGHNDLYAAFIERCLTLTADSFYVAMVTQQSFMYISFYRGLRQEILADSALRSVAHLGPGAFEDIGGQLVNTVLFTLRAGSPEAKHVTVFFKALDVDKKANVIRQMAQGKLSSSVFEIPQSTFAMIEGAPIAYDLSPEIRRHLAIWPTISDVAEFCAGMVSGNNERFFKYHWEVNQTGSTSRWKPLAKGGQANKWAGNLHRVVDWSKEAQDFYRNSKVGRLAGEHRFFEEGLTFSAVSSGVFSVRHLPEGCIFDHAGPSVFSKEGTDIWYLLGYMNARLQTYVLRAIDPTLGFKSSDVARLPFRHPTHPEGQEVSQLSQRCVHLTNSLLATEPNEPGFEGSAICACAHKGTSITLHGAYSKAKSASEQKEIEILLNEACIEVKVANALGLNSNLLDTVFAETMLPAGFLPLLSGLDFRPTALSFSVVNHLNSLECLSLEEWKTTYASNSLDASDPSPRRLLDCELTRLYVGEGCSIEQISAELKINPVSIVALRRELDLINPADFQHEVENFLTHRIWELCKQDEDGIIPYADGLRNPSLLAQVRGEIEVVFGAERAVAIEAEMDEILGRGGLVRWLGDPFFQKHVRQFKKRPILWQITSPDKHFRTLVYYHKLDHDTLPKIRGQYLWPLLERARTQLRAAQDQDPPDLKTISDLEACIADLEECDRRLESVIQGTVEVDLPEWANGPYRDGKPPYDPDLDDGVKVNILPLQVARLLPMRRVV